MNSYKTVKASPPYTLYMADNGTYGLWHGADGWLIEPYTTRFASYEVEAIYETILESHRMRTEELRECLTR